MIRVSCCVTATGGKTLCSSDGSMTHAPNSSFSPEIFPLFSARVMVAFDTPVAVAACPAVYFMARHRFDLQQLHGVAGVIRRFHAVLQEGLAPCRQNWAVTGGGDRNRMGVVVRRGINWASGEAAAAG